MLPNRLNFLYKSSLLFHSVWLHNLQGFPSAVPAFVLCISLLGFFSPRAAASYLNPCSTVARHTRFLTLVPHLSLHNVHMLATPPAILCLPSTSWSADP
jgi:hypothetical protein